MAKVVLENVSKIFDKKVKAVDNISLTAIDHEFLVLVGPSGCGKSTTLRMIAGLETVTSGNISIGENVVTQVPPKDRDIAMVFQNYALYPHMSVYDNMGFALKLKKYSRTEIEKRVKEAAKILNLTHLMDRKPKALSGGQRQRVAVGRAIVRNPAVFLFDEPLSNLDAKLRVQMRIEISKLHKELQTTMIYVTHDQVEAMTMGDRIVVMNEGYVQQVASPLDIYKLPANLFVAGFIGSPAMNFVKGRIIRENGLFFKNDELLVPVHPARSKALESYQDKNVILGIRPEHILPANSNADNMFKGSVHFTELMGNEIIIYIHIYQHSLIARINPDYKYLSGNNIDFTLDTEKLHYFDAETECRIDG